MEITGSNLCNKFNRFTVLAVAITLLAACAGQTKVESDLGIKGAPDWVNEGSQAVNDKKGRLIQGVGSAPNLGDARRNKYLRGRSRHQPWRHST